jgi:hypothetical protein
VYGVVNMTVVVVMVRAMVDLVAPRMILLPRGLGRRGPDRAGKHDQGGGKGHRPAK